MLPEPPRESSGNLYNASDSTENIRNRNQKPKPSTPTTTRISTDRFSSDLETAQTQKLEGSRFSKISKIGKKIGDLINKIAFFKKIDQRLKLQRNPLGQESGDSPHVTRRSSNLAFTESMRQGFEALEGPYVATQGTGSAGSLMTSAEGSLFLDLFKEPDINQPLILNSMNINQDNVNTALGDYGKIFGGDKVSQEVKADVLEKKIGDFYAGHPVLHQIHDKVERRGQAKPGLGREEISRGVGSLTGEENILYRCMLDVQKRLVLLQTEKDAGIVSQPVVSPPKKQKGIPDQQNPADSFIADSVLDAFDDLTQSKINEKVAQGVPDLLSDSLLDLFDEVEETVVQSFSVENPNVIKMEAPLGNAGAKVELFYDPTEETCQLELTLENGAVRECSLNEAINDLLNIINTSFDVTKQQNALHVLGTISGLLKITSQDQEHREIKDDYIDGELAYIDLIFEANSKSPNDYIPSSLREILSHQPPTRAPRLLVVTEELQSLRNQHVKVKDELDKAREMRGDPNEKAIQEYEISLAQAKARSVDTTKIEVRGEELISEIKEKAQVVKDLAVRMNEMNSAVQNGKVEFVDIFEEFERVSNTKLEVEMKLAEIRSELRKLV